MTAPELEHRSEAVAVVTVAKDRIRERRVDVVARHVLSQLLKRTSVRMRVIHSRGRKVEPEATQARVGLA